MDDDGVEWNFYGESDMSDDDDNMVVERPGKVAKVEEEVGPAAALRDLPCMDRSDRLFLPIPPLNF